MECSKGLITVKVFIGEILKGMKITFFCQDHFNKPGVCACACACTCVCVRMCEHVSLCVCICLNHYVDFSCS